MPRNTQLRCFQCFTYHEKSLRCSKRCACHAKRAGHAKWGAQSNQLSRASADLYEGAPSAAPATQNELEVLQVLHLPRKTNLRCSKCCACRAKRTAQSNQSSRGFPKCCTCHTKRAWGAPSAAPATQNEAAPKVINCRQASADLYKVLQVLHLPRKTSLRCSKCCGGAPSAAPATQNEAAPKVTNCSRASADLYDGYWSAAPATQNEPEVLQVLRLPHKNEAAPKVINCRRSADLFEGAPSAAPATQNEPEVLQVLAAPKVTNCRRASADLYKGAASAAPATHNEP